MNETRQKLLRMLPGVDSILELAKSNLNFEAVPRQVLVKSAREVVATLRSNILEETLDIDEIGLSDSAILERLEETVKSFMRPNLASLVNATGVVVHTNLGRSPLADEAIENIVAVSKGYSNLEYDVAAGRRGLRYSAVEELLCELSGAEAAMAVNNNAGAVLLCLETLAKNREVVVSRGELVEIGGSFRIPDVMEKSGGILVEVGTTNRTHPADYENAIDGETALLLKVHKSNYSIVGFSSEVGLGSLVKIGAKHGVPVMEDLGSGTFVDFSRFGMLREPTVRESVEAGADIVTFSGDKMLGGPQAGIVVGKKEIVDRIRRNPLTRALRIDKLTLAALESTLRIYREPDRAMKDIPTLRMLTASFEEMEQKAKRLKNTLDEINDTRMLVEILSGSSRVGGGSLPLQQLPTMCVGVRIDGFSANDIELCMRKNDPPIIGRIETETFIMDPRTIQDGEFPIIGRAFGKMLAKPDL